jgi:acyl-CoA thioesterase YciA
MTKAHVQPQDLDEPRGELASRMLAMPSHTNPAGSIFGGWIMSVMDAAALMTATKIAHGNVVTVFVSNMTFLQPVKVGDAICCYTDITAIGETSITLAVEVWVLRQGQGERIKVTNAEFKFVALNDNGSPRPVLA